MNFKLYITIIAHINMVFACTGYVKQSYIKKQCGSLWKQDMNTTLFKRNSDFHYANPHISPDQDPGNTCYIKLSSQARDYALEELSSYKPETLLESNEITQLIQRPMMVDYSSAQLGDLAHAFSKLLEDLRDSKVYKTVGQVTKAIEQAQKNESNIATPAKKWRKNE